MIYASHPMLGTKILCFENSTAEYQGRTYKLDDSWTIKEEVDYLIQENALAGRYLKTLKDNPFGIKVLKGDILLTISNTKCVSVKNRNIKWNFIFIKGVFELLPIDYKPEEYILPKKWYFKVTPDNYKKFKHIRPLDNDIYGYITNDSLGYLDWGYWVSNLDYLKRLSYEEITFEEFEKYVLYPYEKVKVETKSNTDLTSLNLPNIKEPESKVDRSVNTKLVDIKLPDFSVKPEQIKLIKIEPYKLII